MWHVKQMKIHDFQSFIETELFTSYLEGNGRWNEQTQFTLRIQCNFMRKENLAKNTSYGVSERFG